MPRVGREKEMRSARAARWLPVVMLAMWAATIFTTSCRYIDRDEFIGAVGPWLPAALRHPFAAFWDAGGGLAVVKGYHMAEYALLFLLARFALRSLARFTPPRAAVVAAALCLLYAASDEWHQTFVPGRGGTWHDVAIDACGIALAWFVVRARTPLRTAAKADDGRGRIVDESRERNANDSPHAILTERRMEELEPVAQNEKDARTIRTKSAA